MPRHFDTPLPIDAVLDQLSRTLDLARLKQELAQPVVVDLRNIYRPEDMAALGFTYESVGRGAV